MEYQVFVEGNYLIVKSLGDSTLLESPRKYAAIKQLDPSENVYEFILRNNRRLILDLSVLKDKENVNYNKENFNELRFNI